MGKTARRVLREHAAAIAQLKKRVADLEQQVSNEAELNVSFKRLAERLYEKKYGSD